MCFVPHTTISQDEKETSAEDDEPQDDHTNMTHLDVAGEVENIACVYDHGFKIYHCPLAHSTREADSYHTSYWRVPPDDYQIRWL